MPLPDAKPDPAGSNVYRQLNSIKLGDLTNEQFDIVYQNVFLNDMSEDELRRLALVGAARQSFSPSSSGPIPETLELINQTFDTPNVYKDFYTPATGTVYQLMGVSIGSSTGLSGSGSLEVDVTNISTGDRLIVADFSFTSSSDFPVVESGAMTPVYVDSNHKVRIRAEGTFTSINNVVLGVIRVR